MLDKLQIGKTYADPICTGYGMVKTQHGLLPVPAPATALLLEGMAVFKGDEEGERVTPTGAAVLRYLNPEFTNACNFHSGCRLRSRLEKLYWSQCRSGFPGHTSSGQSS